MILYSYAIKSLILQSECTPMEGVVKVTEVVQHYTRKRKFLGLIILMGQARKDSLRDDWSTGCAIHSIVDRN
jgi:hypothetical protein